MPNFLRKNWLKILILSLGILIVYGPFLNNDFLSDDLPTIVQNPQIGLFSNVIAHNFGFSRPLFYYLAYHIGGLSPIPFRSINLLFHLGSTLLVLLIVSRLHNLKVGFLASLLFALHPLMSEPVIWISGGAYTQATFFTLAAFWTYLNRSKRSYLLSLGLFFIALTSQALALALPAILFLYELTFADLKKNWPKILPFFALALIGLLIGTAGVSFFEIPQRTQTLQTVNYQQVGLTNPLVLVPIAISNYLQLFAWPQGLTLYHSELSFGAVNFMLRVLITLFYLGLTSYFYFKNRKFFFWLSLFLLGIFPTLVTATLGLSWIVAERYVYFAALGLVVFLCLITQRLFQTKPKLAVPIFWGLVIVLAILTIIRNNDWRNEDNLWIATGKTSPSSPNTHNNLGDVYFRHQDYQTAIKEFQKAIELKPNYADAYHNLANAYHQTGQDDLAIQTYQKAVELNPNLWQSDQNIAAIYFQRGDYKQALDYLNKALQISPNNPNLYLSFGVVYLKMEDKDQARSSFSQALKLDPTNATANLGLQQASK